MANYQPPYNFTLNHGGENNTGAQSAGASHPAQHGQGVMEDIVAQPLPTQIPAACEARGSTGKGKETPFRLSPRHTCAVCKAIFPNNYGLEKHAAKERHKAFICSCGTKFVRLATLNRHVAAQAGPKHHCTYCDDNKGFAREDKLIDHLRASHKFGENAIAQFRSQARVQLRHNDHAPSTVATTSAGQPVSTSAGHHAGSGAVSLGQAALSAGTSSGPSGSFDGGMNNFPVFSAAELQPFAPVEDYSWIGAAEDFAGFDFSGIDFSGVDFADFDRNMDF